MAAVPIDLFAFGPRDKGPRPPRAGIDVYPDGEGMIGPEVPPLANGASTFADAGRCPLRGHYFSLPAGTELPEELSVVADGSDVDPDSLHGPTHHTIYPARRMTYDRFVELIRRLPWRYVGKK